MTFYNLLGGFVWPFRCEPARLLIEKHGAEAPIHAAMRADAMLEKGDLDRRRQSSSVISGGLGKSSPAIRLTGRACGMHRHLRHPMSNAKF